MFDAVGHVFLGDGVRIKDHAMLLADNVHGDQYIIVRISVRPDRPEKRTADRIEPAKGRNAAVQARFKKFLSGLKRTIQHLFRFRIVRPVLDEPGHSAHGGIGKRTDHFPHASAVVHGIGVGK